MNGKVNILGVKIDKVTIEEAKNKIISFTESDTTHYVCTPNSEMIMTAYRNEDFKNILNSASLLTADGIGVVKAAKILKNPIKERAAGYDIACRLLEELKCGEKSFYFFGSKPETVKKAKEKLVEKYPSINIIGYSDGYFDKEKEKEIIKDINEKKPDILFVCLGSPKQEKWMYDNKNTINAKVMMGLGGCLDVFAGYVKRAPDIYIKLGVEWLYRLFKEPKRFFRMTDLPVFAINVFLHGRKFKQDDN